MAVLVRLIRASLLEVSRQDYVRTARAKGLSNRVVRARHVLRNSLIPVVTVTGPAMAELVTGSIVIETIFNVPGLGREFVNSITARDYPMIMGTTLFYALLVALANLAVDVSYAVLESPDSTAMTGKRTVTGAASVRSVRRDAWRRFRHNRFAIAGTVYLLLLTGIALAAPVIAPQNPVRADVKTAGAYRQAAWE